MKKIILGIIGLGLIIGAFSFTNNKGVQADQMINDISNKIIRFHVLANSDSDEDQELKFKVRDEVIKYMSPILDKSKSLDESREILKNNQDKVIEIAEKVIKEEGYNYSVRTELKRENFPVKTYGNITLPEGEYEAFRILIGEAKGQNWWCVMFPPLCFVDMTKGQISYDESKEKLEGVLTDEEYDLITDKENSKIKFRFKLGEVFSK
ncbi:stage II sporulation protein R [Clostridium mediterraneense]|uniref:stage II sporulation protein R n=1 Tax=Clostridium mediterraneense TaxID=1805472 RepID=UPI00082EFF29|nr:stage II sporulation protein R [Clostridium mediterraneense]